MGERLAIVIFNLGGPDTQEAVRPFLFNLFNDPNIIGYPQPFRWLLARLISGTRAKKSRALYALLGGGSPLLAETRAQAAALQATLDAKSDTDAKVFVLMRYWHPMAREVVAQVKAFAPNRVVLLPLYPQFSTTTTATTAAAFRNEAKRQKLAAPIDLVCCHPKEEGFVAAVADMVRATYDQDCAVAAQPCHPGAARGLRPRVIFTAHGLPEKIIADGDPYQWQVEKTAKLIAARVDVAGLDWTLAYQSRVGPVKWIGPSLEQEIERAGRDGVPVVVAPITFISEHVETLVELDHEMRLLAETVGVPRFHRVPTVRTNTLYMEALARLALAACGQGTCAGSGARICPANFVKCPLHQPVAAAEGAANI